MKLGVRGGVLAALLAGIAMTGCAATSSQGAPSISGISSDPSREAFLDEPGNRAAQDACVDVLILEGWGAAGFSGQTPEEVGQVLDRMLESGAEAWVADPDKYGDFYLKLGYPGAFAEIGDYEQFMQSLSNLRATCVQFGFEY